MTFHDLVALGDSELLLELHRRADRKGRGTKYRPYWLRTSEFLYRAAMLSQEAATLGLVPEGFLKPGEGEAES